MIPRVKVHLIMLIAVILSAMLMTDAAAASNRTDSVEEGLIREQLSNSEISNIRRAVEKAFSDFDKESGIRISAGELLEDAAKGAPLEGLNAIPKALLVLLGKELKGNFALVLELIAVMVLAAVLRGLQPNEQLLSNQASGLAVNGAMAVIAAASFGGIVQIAREAVEAMQTLASLALPALFALLAASGRLVSVTAFQPLILAGVNVACHIYKTVLLPLAVMAGVLFLVDSISQRFKLKSLAKLIKSCAVWGTGALTLVFSLVVSIQKFSSTAVDAVAVKSAKFAIGTFVPVAGKNMADAAEILLACAGAARNAAGILTIIGLGIAFTLPFLKIFVIMMTYKLAAALGTPLCDEGICNALEDASGCMSVMLGILGASLFSLIILTGSMMSSAGLFN